MSTGLRIRACDTNYAKGITHQRINTDAGLFEKFADIFDSAECLFIMGIHFKISIDRRTFNTIMQMSESRPNDHIIFSTENQISDKQVYDLLEKKNTDEDNDFYNEGRESYRSMSKALITQNPNLNIMTIIRDSRVSEFSESNPNENENIKFNLEMKQMNINNNNNNQNINNENDENYHVSQQFSQSKGLEDMTKINVSSAKLIPSYTYNKDFGYQEKKEFIKQTKAPQKSIYEEISNVLCFYVMILLCGMVYLGYFFTILDITNFKINIFEVFVLGLSFWMIATGIVGVYQMSKKKFSSPFAYILNGLGILGPGGCFVMLYFEGGYDKKDWKEKFLMGIGFNAICFLICLLAMIFAIRLCNKGNKLKNEIKDEKFIE